MAKMQAQWFCCSLLLALLAIQTVGGQSHAHSSGEGERHPCSRECRPHMHMVCQYDFKVEWGYTMSQKCGDCPKNITACFNKGCMAADGYSRPVMAVNKMLPGPIINVCEGDTVVVNVKNDMTTGQATSIHWHGIHMVGEPYMDGMPMVTQCPIPGHTSFQYRFTAKNAGTHVWHDHAGVGRADGIYGAIVVRQTREREPHFRRYDLDLPEEHVIIINDWLRDQSIKKLVAHMEIHGDNNPRSMLINGRGSRRGIRTPDGRILKTPRSVFTVERGQRYRFRFLSNGILNCPVEVSIDGHNLLMIASDGHPFEPVQVSRFHLQSGERYDLVLDADRPIGSYWIHVRGLSDCGPRFHNVHEAAILRYRGAPDRKPPGGHRRPPGDNGKVLNPWSHSEEDSIVHLHDLKSIDRGDVEADNAIYKPEADVKFYLGMDYFHSGDDAQGNEHEGHGEHAQNGHTGHMQMDDADSDEDLGNEEELNEETLNRQKRDPSHGNGRGRGRGMGCPGCSGGRGHGRHGRGHGHSGRGHGMGMSHRGHGGGRGHGMGMSHRGHGGMDSSRHSGHSHGEHSERSGHSDTSHSHSRSSRMTDSRDTGRDHHDMGHGRNHSQHGMGHGDHMGHGMGHGGNHSQHGMGHGDHSGHGTGTGHNMEGHSGHDMSKGSQHSGHGTGTGHSMEGHGGHDMSQGSQHSGQGQSGDGHSGHDMGQGSQHSGHGDDQGHSGHNMDPNSGHAGQSSGHAGHGAGHGGHVHNHEYTLQINGIAHVLPSSPLLTQYDDVDQTELCNSTHRPHRPGCDSGKCRCTHLLNVRLGDVVELVMVDQGATIKEGHPIHIHGYSFSVLSVNQVGRKLTIDDVKKMDADGRLRRNMDRQIRKDTVNVPDMGITIVRFHATNPGYWFLHCHLAFHNEIGMGLILRVGEPRDFPPAPPRFPTCGNWKPPANHHPSHSQIDVPVAMSLAASKPSAGTFLSAIPNAFSLTLVYSLSVIFLLVK